MSGLPLGTCAVDNTDRQLGSKRDYQQDLRTWTQSALPGLRVGGQDKQFAGAGQWKTYDWPVPLGAARAYSNDLRTFVLPPQVQLIGKDRQFAGAGQWKTYDYPNPLGANRPYPNDLRTFINPLEQQFIGQDKQFGAAGQWKTYDYPNPLGVSRPYQTDLRTWLQSSTALNYYSIQLTPFDWQPSSGPQYQTDLRTWKQASPFWLVPPVGQSIFDAPIGANRPYPNDLRTFINPVEVLLGGRDQQFGAPGQFKTYDYPNPIGSQYPSSLRTGAVNLLQNTLGVNAPFSQTDWPLPSVRSYLRTTTAWSTTLLLNSVYTFQPTPFDWGTPRPQAGPPALTWTQDLVRTILAPAVVQRGPLRSLPAQRIQQPPTWTYNLLQNTLTPAATTLQPLPFDWGMAPTGPLLPQRSLTFSIRPDLIPAQSKPYNQYDWPLSLGAARPYQIDLRTWIYTFTPLSYSIYTFQPLSFDWGTAPTGPVLPQRSFIFSSAPALTPQQSKPYNQYDWPNQLGATRAYQTDLRTWLYTFTPLAYSLFTLQALPYDWAYANRTMPSSPTDWQPQNLLNTLLKPTVVSVGIEWLIRARRRGRR